MASEISKWWQGSSCVRCRSRIGLLAGKHNCQACGQTFCSKCSYQRVNVPQFPGLVRLCISCGQKYMVATYGKGHERLSQIGWVPNSQSTQKQYNDSEMQEMVQKEQEELELALVLSQSEAEAQLETSGKHYLYPVADNELKEKLRLQGLMRMEEGAQLAHVMSMREATPKETKKAKDPPVVGPTLAMYLDRSYWEKKKTNNETSKLSPTYNSYFSDVSDSLKKLDIGEQEVVSERKEIAHEVSEICQKANEQVEALKNRMRSTLHRHGSISNDSGLRSLTARLVNSHGHVLSMLTKIEADQEFYTSLQKRVTYIKELRELLQKLRADYAIQKEELRKRAGESGRFMLHQELKRVQQNLYGTQPQSPVSILQQANDGLIGSGGSQSSLDKQPHGSFGWTEIQLPQRSDA